MFKKALWTASYARLKLAKKSKGINLNWIFLPGGPGLGSEYLMPLISILKLPGHFWLLDLPGDGSNTTSNNKKSFSHWEKALIEAVDLLENVVLVGHSTGGMFALAAKGLKSRLKGLVLMNSAPDCSWQKDLQVLPKLKKANNNYLKKMTLEGAPHMFATSKGLKEGKQLLEKLPYNYETFHWSEKNFDRNFRAKWFPDKIPCLILAGDKDIVTPISCFSDKKKWHRKNILMKEIKNAGHFPWMDNPKDVASVFNTYFRKATWQFS